MSRSSIRVSRRLLATTVSAGFLVCAAALPAVAHASLVRTSPADGSSLAKAPTRVVLTFDESLGSQADIVVSDIDGRRVDRGPVSVVDNTVSKRVAIAEPGLYDVAFRVVSDDGHPEADRTTFTVEAGAGTAGSAGSIAGSSPSPTTAATQPAGQQQVASAPSHRRKMFVGGLAVAALVAGVALLLTGTRRGDRVAARTRETP